MDVVVSSNVFIFRVDRSRYKDIRSIYTFQKVGMSGSRRRLYLKGAFGGVSYVKDLDLGVWPTVF